MKEYKADKYIRKADDHYYNAMNLYKIYVENNFPSHRYDPLSHIMASCSLAGEIHIKAYMEANDIAYDHNHKMGKHLNLCVEREKSFETLRKDIDFLVNYTSGINYPNEIAVTKSNAKQAIKAVQNIINFDAIKQLRKKYGIEDVELLIKGEE